MQASPVKGALTMAWWRRRPLPGLIFHRDRDRQYNSSYYQAIHHRHDLQCSIADGYDCYQNVMAERVNGILKSSAAAAAARRSGAGPAYGAPVGPDLQRRAAASIVENANARCGALRVLGRYSPT